MPPVYGDIRAGSGHGLPEFVAQRSILSRGLRQVLGRMKSLLGWRRRRVRERQARTVLFPNCAAFVDGDPDAAGFGELHPSEGFRWVNDDAVCLCPLPPQGPLAQPCLVVRAIAPRSPRPSYLSVSVGRRHVGTQLIPGYDSYFFPLRDTVSVEAPAGSSIDVALSVLGSAPGPEPPRVGVYDVHVVDLERNDFPERHVFFEQVKIFEPAGGDLYRILSGYPFRSGAQILDVGAGLGWTTVLLSGFSGARAWCVDLHEYARPGGVNFKTELRERFERHRSALKNVPAMTSLVDPAALDQAIERCTFLTMDAEAMLLPDNAFAFAFSLNAFEHIPHPDRALAEIYRVLRPGGHALLQFSPLYCSDAGSHLPMTVGLNRPWAHLVMTRDEIKQTIRERGGSTNEVDSILDSLNGWTPARFREAVARSGFRVLFADAQTGFTLDGAERSPELARLRGQYSDEDLTTFHMLWFLEKPESG
jgi:SAM-dependent methyltransferase